MAIRNARLITFGLLVALVASDSPSDPHCSLGVISSNGDVCCLKSCGKLCAEHGCGNAKGGGENCCGGTISKNGRECDKVGAPCIIHPLPPSPSPPSPGGCVLNTGIEYLAGSISTPSSQPDVAACCSHCSKTTDCQFFTFDMSNTTCFLKNNDAPELSRMAPGFVSGSLGSFPPAPRPPATVTVEVNAANVLSKTRSNYVCWNLDSSRNRQFFDRDINPTRPFGQRMANLAKAISDAQGSSPLRFGGSGNDMLYNYLNVSACPSSTSLSHECLNQTQYDSLATFAAAANADMVYGLNLNLRDSDGHWDVSDAEQLIIYANAKGYKFYAFQLGNEENEKYTGAQVAADFAILQTLLIKHWPDASTRPHIIGPSPHSFKQTGPDSKLEWIADFEDGCKKLGVDLFAMSHHEYIEIDSTSFLSAKKLDVTAAIATAVNFTSRSHYPSAEIWAGEIGPHNGGSPPCDHTSMRWSNFGDAIWYADALATKAKYGYQGFCRQDFIGADYGLLDCATGAPLPDFWIAVLWTRLMGETVLAASVSSTNSSAIRVYSHCSKTSSGGVTVLLINLYSDTVNVTVNFGEPAGSTARRSEYHLTSQLHGSITNATGLLGQEIALNGGVLTANDDGSGIPASYPGSSQPLTAPISLGPASVAFVVFPKGQGMNACGTN